MRHRSWPDDQSERSQILETETAEGERDDVASSMLLLATYPTSIDTRLNVEYALCAEQLSLRLLLMMTALGAVVPERLQSHEAHCKRFASPEVVQQTQSE